MCIVSMVRALACLRKEWQNTERKIIYLKENTNLPIELQDFVVESNKAMRAFDVTRQLFLI